MKILEYVCTIKTVYGKSDLDTFKDLLRLIDDSDYAMDLIKFNKADYEKEIVGIDVYKIHNTDIDELFGGKG